MSIYIICSYNPLKKNNIYKSRIWSRGMQPLKKPIGFQQSWQQQEDNITKTGRELSEIDIMITDLSKEVTTCQDFEKTLLDELSNLASMEKNLESVNTQLKSIKKQAETKKVLSEELIIEYEKKLDMDIDKCKSIYYSINRISEDINDNIRVAYNALTHLIIDNTHKMYLESEENRTKINTISDNAKQLRRELDEIIDYHRSRDSRIEAIRIAVSKIEIERKHLKPK